MYFNTKGWKQCKFWRVWKSSSLIIIIKNPMRWAILYPFYKLENWENINLLAQIPWTQPRCFWLETHISHSHRDMGGIRWWGLRNCVQELQRKGERVCHLDSLIPSSAITISLFILSIVDFISTNISVLFLLIISCFLHLVTAFF